MCGSFPGLLIGRTAVHSGKDPAFAAYDQFLSTGILQPLSQDEVRYGSLATEAVEATPSCMSASPLNTDNLHTISASPLSANTGREQMQQETCGVARLFDNLVGGD